MTEKLEQLLELYQGTEFKKATGLDEAIIGVFGNEWNNDKPPVLAYSQKKVIEILMREMSYDKAMEHFDFNIIDAYMGVNTPIFIDDMHEFEGDMTPDIDEDEETEVSPETNYHESATRDYIGMAMDIEKMLTKKEA